MMTPMADVNLTPGPWLVCVATAHELRPLRRLLMLRHDGRETAGRVYAGQAGRHGVVVLQTGIGPERAYQAVRRGLDGRMCQGVVSIGVSGGLRDSLPSGSLVIGDEWMHVGTRVDGVRSEVARSVGPPADRRWRAAALQAAAGCGVTAHQGELVTVDHVVGTVEEKRALAGRTTALAVDMESAAVAEVALAAGLPVVAARVILDPLEEALPVSPEEFLNPDGSSSIWKSGLAVAARPVRLPMLWDVGRRSTHAMELLGRWLWRFLDTDTAADR